MRTKSFSRDLLFLICLWLVLTNATSQAQKTWSKYPGNPVLKLGGYDEFDDEQVKQPTVIFDGGIFKMWYVGRNNFREQIGYAESQDGIHWIKKGPVLPFGNPGEFDCLHQNTPKVLKIGADYHLWYSGFDDSYWRIGKAISPDGLSWKKQGVVLEKGNPGDFDALHVSAPMVLRLNSNYFLWYEGFDGDIWRIGFAISADGLIWQKQGLALELGSADEFDWAGHAHPEVLVHNGLFQLWYSGYDGRSWRIGYATSSIGNGWQKYGIVLNVSPPGCFDSGDVADCSVLFDGAHYQMWFSGDVFQDWQIGYAVEDTTWENLFIDVSQETKVSGPWEAGSAFGDFNNDGYQDLYLGYRYGPNALLINNKGQAFANLAAQSGVDYDGWSCGVSCADFNNDGYLDIYVSNHNVPNILYKNSSDLMFKDIAVAAGVATDLNSYHAVWGDYNNDGLVDLYVINFEPDQANILYRNNGDETFTDVTSLAKVDGRPEQKSRSACWADYNNDGLLDLFVINQGEDVLYRNNGNGTFDNVTVEAGIYDTGNGYSCAWGDANNDGFLDLYLANRYTRGALFLNQQDGRFIDATVASGLDYVVDASTCSWADFDNDGDLDLYVGNGWGGYQYLCSNNGQGQFENVTSASGLNNYRSVNSSTGDYNNDGALDLFLTASQEGEFQAHLYRNQGNSNHWITLNLIGAISNRSAIGTRIRLVSGQLSQIREVSGGYGLLSFDSLPLEFGIGRATRVDSLIVRWPSGIITVLVDVMPDQILTIHERLLAHDIAAVQIVSPKSMTMPGAVIPQVMIKNLGENTEKDFSVTCLVDSLGTIVYADSQKVALLTSLETTPVTFAPWTPIKGTEYAINFITNLPGDLNPQNDRLTRRVVTPLDHDIMMRYIASPGPKLYQDEVVPIAVIQNIGSSNEFQFDVTCEVYDNQSLVYRGTQTVIQIAPLDTLPIRFGVWQTTDRGPFLFQFFSQLPHDENLTNDTLSVVVYVENLNVNQLGMGTALPEKFLLSNNYPNPFNGLTTIEYHVPAVAKVTVDIYDLVGRHIKTLAAREHQPGIHLIAWDASDDCGNRMASGVYFVRMKAPNFERMRKIIYLK